MSVHVTAMIHEKAHVENATVGRLSRVWQFASVIRGAVIGEECRIAAGAIVDGARVGNRTIVSHGAFLNPGIWIGDDVFIGPHVALCNDFWPRADKTGFDMTELLSGALVTTKILSGASLGANAVILPGVTIGRGAMIAAGAVAAADVPDNCLLRRNGTLAPIDPHRAIRRLRAAA